MQSQTALNKAVADDKLVEATLAPEGLTVVEQIEHRSGHPLRKAQWFATMKILSSTPDSSSTDPIRSSPAQPCSAETRPKPPALEAL
jgi:hypothetical protein